MIADLADLIITIITLNPKGLYSITITIGIPQIITIIGDVSPVINLDILLLNVLNDLAPQTIRPIGRHQTITNHLATILVKIINAING